jgi:hypothetical protein
MLLFLDASLNPDLNQKNIFFKVGRSKTKVTYIKEKYLFDFKTVSLPNQRRTFGIKLH